MKKFNLLFACDENRVMGKGNTLPWPLLEADMERFRKLTSRNTVVMGRTTWDSLPEKFKPLPNRMNIVISRDENFDAEGKATVVRSIDEIQSIETRGRIFLIGGAKLFETLDRSMLEGAYVTIVKGQYDGDVILSEEFFEEYVYDDEISLMDGNVKSLEYRPSGTFGIPSVLFVDIKY